VTFSFDATNCVVWLDTIAEGGAPRAGDLCTRHADGMSPPRGWDRVDRRPPRPAPKPYPERQPGPRVDASAAATSAPPARKPRSTRRRTPRPDQPRTDHTHNGQPSEPAWLPRFANEDDLDGVLDVSTPLLSRAFGQARPSESTDDTER
jgi:hypothetical protein